MFTLLNIGMNESALVAKNQAGVRVSNVRAVLEAARLPVCSMALFSANRAPLPLDAGEDGQLHDNERTLVVMVWGAINADLGDAIAQVLGQEAIAVVSFEPDTGRFSNGSLQGFHANSWGAFNPDFCIDLMGCPITGRY